MSEESDRKIKLSVVTAVRNGEPFIRETVDSILSQEGDFELEYIVRDGCSIDGTLEILSGYDDARMTVVSQADGGPHEAINAGMATATGEIGCWLNADDVFEPGTLELVARAFRADTSCRWLYGRCRIIDNNGREIRKPITWYKNLLGFVYCRHMLLCENFINQPATFWRLDLWREIAGLNPRYHAAWDYDLWLQMADVSAPRHIRRTLSSFRRHPDSISETSFELQFQEQATIAATRGNRLHQLLHRLLVRKTLMVYRMCSKE
ncbi:MAG: glycosyltransferase [Lentisphaeria bacterium]|nr:glycosyltransferase [Lentisphaeria bacterium]